jgi:ATP-dependent Clp protease ATP-binding subunit ClpC
VDFTNTVIILTSNVGSNVIQQNLAASKPKGYEELKQELMSVLRAQFKPEFLNRIDEIIVFRPLTKEQIKLIVKLQLERVKRTARGQGVELLFSDAVLDYLAEVGYQPEYGARELKRQIQSVIETSLAKELLAGRIKEGDKVLVDFDKSKVVFIKQVKNSAHQRI